VSENPPKHLKEKIYYSDLYDRGTVEHLRRSEKFFNESELPPVDGKKLEGQKAVDMRSWLKEFSMHFEAGELYLNKEKTIREWMDRDEKRDELYESAQAPEGIRCLTCRNLMKPTFKEFWSELDKPDRIFFMYDCPNNCVPRRAFFSDGEEWRVKPNLCPQCSTKLDQKETNSEEKVITEYTCPKCGYTKTDEFEWTKKKEEPFDEKFAADRDRFCLTDEQGRKFQEEKFQIEQMAKFSEEWKEKEKARDEKLKANPKGFHLEGAGYTCFICGGSTPEGDNWYDEYGIKCLVCQKAIDDGEIPASLAKDKDSWYSTYDLESRFNIKAPTLRKWIRDGLIKARTVSQYGKGVHVELFLVEDNKDFLPPKKLTESQGVTEEKDGKTWHTTEKWYRFVDPVEHLKGYKIMEHLRVIPPEEMKAREEAEKKKRKEKQACWKEKQEAKLKRKK
jgi:hypothetical protein